MKRISSYLAFSVCLGFLVLSSCSSKKKVLVGGGYKGKGSTSGVLSDASSARGVDLTGSNLENYAKLLNVSVRDLNNRYLYGFINDWMGSPHRLGGQTKSGIDCSGFVGILYKDVYGKIIPRTSRDMGALVNSKRESQLKEGDLVFFSFGGGAIDHVGVYLHNNKFVHVSTRKGVIISDLTDSWYAKYFTGAGTIKL
ncbi:C40 family peptidase [Sphingobacterium spiritivorum]|uniref:C40 family peptidase n=1 Tax=Sphingobacterium spiritivorum TaxID=258 RepID=UPI00056A4C53|nr:NlpC/P60 family protein [Sphingobacterium spiritivorum]QQT34149.1 C40 family peptidase [Sphingobacterium spiritivorum]WQD34983.1 NlpC/P60 family protein [Sphingobacterium spiritivorum]SUI98820.1 Probable endopeptidase Spr precursor [Sphingobacterium spiritivorum]